MAEPPRRLPRARSPPSPPPGPTRGSRSHSQASPLALLVAGRGDPSSYPAPPPAQSRLPALPSPGTPWADLLDLPTASSLLPQTPGETLGALGETWLRDLGEGSGQEGPHHTPASLPLNSPAQGKRGDISRGALACLQWVGISGS